MTCWGWLLGKLSTAVYIKGLKEISGTPQIKQITANRKYILHLPIPCSHSASTPRSLGPLNADLQIHPIMSIGRPWQRMRRNRRAKGRNLTDGKRFCEEEGMKKSCFCQALREQRLKAESNWPCFDRPSTLTVCGFEFVASALWECPSVKQLKK